MHRDTVFTPIDPDTCLAHEPVVIGDSGEAATVYEIDLHGEDLRPHVSDRLLTALARRGVDLQPVLCGGNDPLNQQREQWTDGANALAVAPGMIILYDRNLATAEALDRQGYEIVQARDGLSGSVTLDPDGGKKVCVLVPSHEISRARGGPHCLTHAMVRDPLPDEK